jgi:hypothetical protein
MSNILNRILKLAEISENDEVINLIDNFFAKYGHFIPNNNNNIPEFWKRNLDYDPREESPYYGNVNDFLKKFPGGIKQWLKCRKRKNKKS